MAKLFSQDTLNHLDRLSVPDTFKLGRDAQVQLTNVEKNLFTDLEAKESGNYVISGLTQKVSELDLSSFSFAVGQILYNQSYKMGNTETNSGADTKEANRSLQMKNQKTYTGTIITSLNDLCRYAYGVPEPSTEQKKAMSALVSTLHECPVVIRYPDGSERKSVLCAKMEEFKDKNGAITYGLYLNPIFCSNVKDNFAELPQDFMFRLSSVTKKKTAAHLRLARLLSLQDKRKPCTRTIVSLVVELGLEDSYKKNRSRTEKQLSETFESMVNVGLLSRYSITEKAGRRSNVMDKVTFYYNPNFLPRLTKNKIEEEHKKES